LEWVVRRTCSVGESTGWVGNPLYTETPLSVPFVDFDNIPGRSNE